MSAVSSSGNEEPLDPRRARPPTRASRRSAVSSKSKPSPGLDKADIGSEAEAEECRSPTWSPRVKRVARFFRRSPSVGPRMSSRPHGRLALGPTSASSARAIHMSAVSSNDGILSRTRYGGHRDRGWGGNGGLLSAGGGRRSGGPGPLQGSRARPSSSATRGRFVRTAAQRVRPLAPLTPSSVSEPHPHDRRFEPSEAVCRTRQGGHRGSRRGGWRRRTERARGAGAALRRSRSAPRHRRG